MLRVRPFRRGLCGHPPPRVGGPRRDFGGPGQAARAWTVDVACVVEYRPAVNDHEIKGFFGPALTIRGKLSGAGSLRLAGRFEGEIQLDGQLVVDAGGRLVGPMTARQIAVDGRVDGAVAGEDVAIREGGRVVGDVRAVRVALEDGGVLDGTVEMDVDLGGVFGSEA